MIFEYGIFIFEDLKSVFLFLKTVKYNDFTWPVGSVML